MNFYINCNLNRVCYSFRKSFKYKLMRVTLTDGSNFINLQVDNDQQIEDVKALLEVQTGIPSQQLQLFFEGVPLQDNDTLSARKIYEDAVVYFVAGQPKPKPKPKLGGIAEMVKNFDKQIKSVRDEGYEFHHRKKEEFEGEAKRLIEELKDDPSRLAEMSVSHPDVGAAVSRGDVAGLAAIMHKRNEQRIRELKEKERRFLQLSKDPMNPEYQRMLEERIQQENIDKNMEFANEYLPESFGHITMLYIKASINRIPINAFVDSGAQSTIMSQALAQRCGLMRLVDKRYAGKAVGVGSCKILGKVHAAQIEIEGKHLTCSFTVIQNNSVEFLLGLDMLRRFNCIIDLGKNALIFQGGLITTQFLSDGEVQKAKNPRLSKQELQVKVKKITDMGFTKAQAMQTLRACGYNEQVAGNMLMQNKFGNK